MRILTRGLGVAILVGGLSATVHAQRLPTDIEQMGDLAAALQQQLERNRELVTGMQDYEAELQAHLNQALDAGLNLSAAIINKQLESVYVKLRAEQFERLRQIKGSSDRIKKGHKVYTLVKDIVDDTRNSGTGTAIAGAGINILSAASKNPFIANARAVRKLTELGVITIFDAPRRQEVLEEFRAEVRRAEQRNSALAQDLVARQREIRMAISVRAPADLDRWGIRLQDAAISSPKVVADLGAELDSFETGFDQAISVGGIMVPVRAVKAGLIPVARSTFRAVREATEELAALSVREERLQRDAAAIRNILTQPDRDLRDQLDVAVQQVDSLFLQMRNARGNRPRISAGQVNFLTGPAYRQRGALQQALDDLQDLLDSIPNRVAQRNTQRAQQAGVTPVLTGIRIDLGAGAEIAADTLTARMTGKPHSVPFVVMGRHRDDTRRDCTFQVESGGRILDRVRSQRVFQSGPDLAVRASLSGERASRIGGGIITTIEGNGVAGVDEIVAEAVGMVGFTQEPVRNSRSADACRDFLPKMEPVRATRRVEVVRVTGARMTLRSSIPEEGELLDQSLDLDAFVSFDDNISVRRTGFRIELKDFELTRPDRVLLLRNSTPLSFDGAGDLIVAQDGDGVAFTALRPGSGFYSVFIEDGQGGRHFQEDLDITANVLGMEVEPLEAASDFFEPVVDLISQNEIRMIVDGGSRMAGYRVRWRTDGGVQLTTPVSRFRGDGAFAIAATSLTATDPAEAAGKRYTVTAELLSPAGVQVATGSVEVVAAIVGKDIRLVAKGTNVGVAAKDIFIPARKNDFGAFEVQVKTDGQRVQSPLRFFDVRVLGNGFLRFEGDVLKATFDALGGGANTTTRDTGPFVARAEPRQASPEGTPKFIFPGLLSNSDSTFVTVNKLNVKQQDSGAGPQTVLEVFGPADMQKYRARFVLRDGGTLDGSFASADAAAEAVADVAPDVVRAAQVIGRSGQVLGEFRPGDDGPVLGPPQFTFRIPNTAAPGQSVVIFANVQNVSFDDAGDFDCRWSADPSFGTFDRTFVTLAPVSGNGGMCVNTLRVADDPQLVGQEAPIEVDLFRVVGNVARGAVAGAE